MGETWAPKANKKTHKEAASSSQLAAAHSPARERNSGLLDSSFMRNATLLISDITVAGLVNGT